MEMEPNILQKESFDLLIRQSNVSGHTFTVDVRYDFRNARIMGRGSFGVVTRAFDTVRGFEIAIKRVRPYADDIWGAVHHLREIKIIKRLSFHPNIISLYNLSVNEAKKELYMYLELMDSDLARIINSNQTLTEQHFKCFMKQILEGIHAMHQLGIFHRDLKPGNILLTKDCHIRIADLGLARFMHPSTLQGENEDKPMTHAVVTTWYRCLELLLAPINTPYSTAVDMWSIGCIFAELMMRKAIFPGKNHLLQIQSIFQIVGYIPPEELGFPLTQEAVQYLNTKVNYEHKEWTSLIPAEFASEPALTLLVGLLTVDPAKRITAEAALQLPYLHNALCYCDYSQYHFSKEVCTKIEQELAEDFFFEEQFVPLSMLQELLHDEIASCEASAYRQLTVASRKSAWKPAEADDLCNGEPLLDSVAISDHIIPVHRQLTKAEATYSNRLKATDNINADEEGKVREEDDVVVVGDRAHVQEYDVDSGANNSSLLPSDASSKSSVSQQLPLCSNQFLPVAANGGMEGLGNGFQMKNPFANPNATPLCRRSGDSRSSSTSSLSSASGLDEVAVPFDDELQPVVGRSNSVGGGSPAANCKSPSSSSLSGSSISYSSRREEEKEKVFDHARSHLLCDDSNGKNQSQHKPEVPTIDQSVVITASLPLQQSPPNRMVHIPIEISPTHEPAISKENEGELVNQHHKPPFQSFGMHRSDLSMFPSPSAAISSTSSVSHVLSPSAASDVTSRASSWSSASWSFSQDESHHQHGKYFLLPAQVTNTHLHPTAHTSTHKQGLGKRRLSRTGLLLRPSSASLLSLFGSFMNPATSTEESMNPAAHSQPKR